MITAGINTVAASSSVGKGRAKADLVRLEAQILEKLLETWQPMAAIAEHAGVTNERAHEVLQRKRVDWNLDWAESRIDGHNLVHFYRKRPATKIQVMGVWMPISKSDSEATKEGF